MTEIPRELLGLGVKATTIAAAVATMMMGIEYANVRTRGAWMKLLGRSRWRQYLLSVLLGASPGCFGAYVVVALYVDRRVTLGALTAAMIATSGDESLVMLALFPGPALGLMVGLAILGAVTGWLVDRVTASGLGGTPAECAGFTIHGDQEEEPCDCRAGLDVLVANWSPPSVERAVLVGAALVLGASVALGWIGPAEWDWERVLLIALAGLGVGVSAITPDHFVTEHLWHHVVKQHVPRIVAWTFGVFLVVWGIQQVVPLHTWVGRNPGMALLAAALLGLIPESGPHLFFVKLYADGILPLSVLVASSVVQDGHGMLPLLAHSRRDFLKVKGINLAAGLLAAGALYLAGW